MRRIATPKPLREAQPMRHKVACTNCPSAHFAPDPESQDIQSWPHSERVTTAFPCGWNGTRYCKGYCDQMGINDEDLAREFGHKSLAQEPGEQQAALSSEKGDSK